MTAFSVNRFGIVVLFTFLPQVLTQADHWKYLDKIYLLDVKSTKLAIAK